MTARQTEAERRAATILRLDHAVAYVRDYVLRAEDPTGCGVILTQLIELRRRFERATDPLREPSEVPAPDASLQTSDNGSPRNYARKKL